MVEANAVTWDVVDVDTQTALAGCAEGTFETLDWAKLGLDRSKFIGGDVTDCAVPNILYSTVAPTTRPRRSLRPTCSRRCSTPPNTRASARCRRAPSSTSNGR
jgi:hypothetical protein